MGAVQAHVAEAHRRTHRTAGGAVHGRWGGRGRGGRGVETQGRRQGGGEASEGCLVK